VRVQKATLSAEVGGFINEIDDYIYSRPTGVMVEVDGDSFEVFQTVQGNARLVGYEVAADFHPERHVHLNLTSDFVHGDNTDTDTPLPWIPAVRALYGVRYEADSIGGATGIYVGIRGESVAEQDRLDPFDTSTPSYTLAHAEAGLRIPFGGRSLALDLAARNLTDKAYRDFLSRYKTYADAPGRSVTVRLTVQF
jgi:iron complex outermembrane receptor protein